MSKSIKLIVATDHKYPIHQIADLLEKSGFITQDIHDAADCIVGSADECIVDALKKTKGVIDISPDIQIDLPPPEHGATW